jgi:hypothetical protein
VTQNEFKTKDVLSSYEKSYWFLRMFVNGDRYGGLHKKPKLIRKLQAHLGEACKSVESESNTDNEKAMILNKSLHSFFEIEYRHKKTGKEQISGLLSELDKYLKHPSDYQILHITLRDILLTTNESLKDVPDAGLAYDMATKYAKTLLDSRGESGLSNILRDWDLITEDISLNRERDLIVDLISTIKSRLSSSMSDADISVIISGACQEYERRVSQKRKQRAGKDLENATHFILKYFDIPAASGPDHFNIGLEVDNWVQDQNGWFIGISLKRTLRERWKQTVTTKDELTRFRIRCIIHLINNDRDLSIDKLAEMGAQRHKFFLADSSQVLTDHASHPVVGDFIFPMSSFIVELKKMMIA